MSKDEIAEMMRSMSDECKKNEGASDLDVDMMIDEKYPQSKEGKCMIACMQGNSILYEFI
jgi:hypothetical protein